MAAPSAVLHPHLAPFPHPGAALSLASGPARPRLGHRPRAPPPRRLPRRPRPGAPPRRLPLDPVPDLLLSRSTPAGPPTISRPWPPRLRALSSLLRRPNLLPAGRSSPSPPPTPSLPLPALPPLLPTLLLTSPASSPPRIRSVLPPIDLAPIPAAESAPRLWRVCVLPIPVLLCPFVPDAVHVPVSPVPVPRFEFPVSRFPDGTRCPSPIQVPVLSP